MSSKLPTASGQAASSVRAGHRGSLAGSGSSFRPASTRPASTKKFPSERLRSLAAAINFSLYSLDMLIVNMTDLGFDVLAGIYGFFKFQLCIS